MAPFVINIHQQKLLTLREAGATVAFHRPDGTPADISIVYKACKEGRVGMSRKRIKLPVVMISSGMRTTQEALDWWIAAMSERTPPEPPI